MGRQNPDRGSDSRRAGDSGSLDDLNEWLQLAMNIWNTTPQPDRGGKSAYELSRRGAE